MIVYLIAMMPCLSIFLDRVGKREVRREGKGRILFFWLLRLDAQ